MGDEYQRAGRDVSTLGASINHHGSLGGLFLRSIKAMPQHLAHIALTVREYDEAIAYYVGVLGFELVADEDRGNGKRWVLVRPSGSDSARGCSILLARGVGAAQLGSVGNQTGGRVFLFLHTDDFARDHAAYVARGVRFIESPRREAFGVVAVFEDLYGNKWDLIEPAGADL